MRILIAGKRKALRNALKTLLQTRPGIEVVATAVNKDEFFKLNEATRPDLILLDEDLAKVLKDTVVQPMQASNPKSLIIILGQRSEAREAYLDAGAAAYLTKDDSPQSLLTVIEEARLQSKYVQ